MRNTLIHRVSPAGCQLRPRWVDIRPLLRQPPLNNLRRGTFKVETSNERTFIIHILTDGFNDIVHKWSFTYRDVPRDLLSLCIREIRNGERNGISGDDGFFIPIEKGNCRTVGVVGVVPGSSETEYRSEIALFAVNSFDGFEGGHMEHAELVSNIWKAAISFQEIDTSWLRRWYRSENHWQGK